MSLLVDIEKKLGNFHLRAEFDAPDGVTGILGASGCGKSITLRCIAGIERPDRGHIELDGRVLYDSRHGIDLPAQQRRVGYLFQNYALFPNMTVEQNIAAGGEKRRSAAVTELLESFRLTDCRYKYPRQLSGGQQQRTALARIIASRPQSLLLDEPFSALDSFLKRQIELELLDRLDSFSGPVLFVTHSRDEICHMCGRVCVLDRGRSEPMQSVYELMHSPKTLSACRLSGCENISRAKLCPDGRLLAQDWGVTLSLANPAPADLSYVGIFAEHITGSETMKDNCFPYTCLRTVSGARSGTEMISLSPDKALLQMEIPPSEKKVSAPYVWLPADKLLLLTAH